MNKCGLHSVAKAGLSFMLMALAACLSSQNARAGTGTITGTQEGPTPFISYVSAVYGGGTLQSVAYEILPQFGSSTRPMIASYSAQYLTSTGALQSGSNSLTVPVFGLYQNYNNTVYIYFYFTDGTASEQFTVISTPAYQDPCSQLNRPTLSQQNRTQTSDFNFDYFLLKDECSHNSPAIIDTDGNIRWVGQANLATTASALYNNGIYLSDLHSGILRMELTTGALTNIGNYAGAPYNVTYTGHHNIDPGRDGLIVDVNTTTETEAVDLEFNPTTGTVLNYWDLGQIISYAMNAGGDNPANFVLGTKADWFHNNATAYNPADNTLIVSSRENFVIAVDYDTPPDGQKKIHWILGDTSKAWYQYPSLRAFMLTPANSDTLPPIGQHAVSVDHNGLLLLFDDGQGSLVQKPAGISRSYSAIREYAINSAAMTATAGNVYYSPNPAVFNELCGSVYDVRGSLLVDFPDIVGGPNLVLQGLGASGNIVFNLLYPPSQCSGGWNAYPIVSNIFEFSGSASSPSFNVSVTQFTLALNASQSGQVAVNVSQQNGFSGSVAFTATGFPAGVRYSFSPTSSMTSSTLSVTAAAGTTPGSYPITISGTSGSLISSVTMSLVVSAEPPPTATFIEADPTTQGKWQGVYGSDGYNIINNAVKYPSYAVVTASNEAIWSWAASTSDVRGLQTASGTGRIAAAWYGSTFSIDVNLVDGLSHQVALYLVDWDNKNRAETINIRDAATNAVLNSRDVSNFTAGQYLAWTVSGHITIQIVKTSGSNAVVSGIFFDAAGAPPPPPPSSSASYVKSDTTTQGAWIGTYGSQGYSLASAGQSFSIPATFLVQGQQNWTWAVNPSRADPRDLQTDSHGDTVAAAWYNPKSFKLDLSLTDGATHQVVLYLLDWDRLGRAETITIVDANNNTATLDTRIIPSANTNTTNTNFGNGTYLIWNIAGHVTITVTTNTSANAVVSGLFIDP